MSSPLSRRAFIKRSALFGAATFLSTHSWGQVAGANGDVRVAVIGLNGRGKNHLSNLAKIPGVRVVALCDPDTAVLEKAAQSLGGKVKTYVDVRELLASSDVDAITIATPNHWHSLARYLGLSGG